MERPETLHDQLMGTHIAGSNEAGNYRDNIQKMLVQKMSRANRIVYGLIAIVSVTATLYFAAWVFKTNYGSELPAFIMRIMCGTGLIFSGIVSFFSGWSAFTGKVRGRFYPGFMISSAVVVLCYFMIALFYMVFILPIMMELPNSWQTPLFYTSSTGIQLMLLGFFAMVAVGFIFLFRMLSDLKFNHKKKLLEIEYKLCELLEKIERK